MAVKQSKANITRYPVEYLRVPNDVILNEGPDPDENQEEVAMAEEKSRKVKITRYPDPDIGWREWTDDVGPGIPGGPRPI